MDKIIKNIPLVVLLVAIAFSIFATYYRFFVTRDFDIYTQVSCNPQIESCYKITGCPQDMADCSNPETTFYKILRIKAFDSSYCNHNVESCAEPACNPGNDCDYIKCDSNITAGSQVCGDTTTQ